MSVQSRKSPRPKLKKINVSKKSQWKNILKDVEKNEIPISLLQAIGVNLIDGTVINIDIKELLAAGNDTQQIEDMLDLKLRALDDIIADVDFYVNINDVVNTVQPITDQMLKNL